MTTAAPDHILLTRFNLPSVGHESLIRAQEGWLRNRVELFQTFCMPSVLAQTSNNFSWLIYFDPESPEWLKARIASWKQTRAFRPMFRATVSREELTGDILEVIGRPPRTSLITTNLDNDDGLAVNFVERLQQIHTEAPRTALWLANGIIIGNGRIYRRTDKRNAFCSVKASWDDPIMCWVAPHNKLSLIMPEKIAYGEPAWLQVIHGANVSNRIKGKLSSPANYYALFAGRIDDVGEPTFLDHANDLCVQTPKRLLREGIRGTAKILIASVFGPQGLDRTKAIFYAAVQKVTRLARLQVGIVNRKRG